MPPLDVPVAVTEIVHLDTIQVGRYRQNQRPKSSHQFARSNYANRPGLIFDRQYPTNSIDSFYETAFVFENQVLVQSYQSVHRITSSQLLFSRHCPVQESKYAILSLSA